jgi:hypothetical protein
MVGCFRKSDAGDPEIYTRALVALLMSYPESVVNDVTGRLPYVLKWLPSLGEVKEACDSASHTANISTHWDRVVAETLARRVKPVEREAPRDGDRLAGDGGGTELGREFE